MHRKSADRHGLFLTCGAIVVAASSALVLAMALGLAPARARPAYARRTGLPCGQCHVNPAGGGPRTAFGRAFARNGHRLPSHSSRTYRRSHRGHGYRYHYHHHGDGMGPSMMGGYGGYGMGPGMMGGYGPDGEHYYGRGGQSYRGKQLCWHQTGADQNNGYYGGCRQ